MCFREITEAANQPSSGVHCSAASRIGLIFLDEALNPVGDAQLLDLNGQGTLARTDDARLIVVADALYLVYGDNVDDQVSEGGFRVYVAKLSCDGNGFAVEYKDRLSQFQGEFPWRREKNWSPFDYQGSLLLIYSPSPHKVFYPLPGQEVCVTVGYTRPELSWKWGEPRGGTPGILVDGEYLTLFHSSVDMVSAQSNGVPALHYFIGAYTFAKDPPFAITRMSPSPLVAKGFYSGESYVPYWKPVRVVFPCGLIADGPFLWMAYGRQDHEVWIAKIDKQGLLDSLVPVGLKD